MKHPAVRVKSIRDLQPETVEQIRLIFVEFQSLLPFPVVDFEWTGSYARECADLHSDMDINIATGTEADRQAAIDTMKRLNKTKWTPAVKKFRTRLWTELGMFCDISLEAPTIADIPEKRCYRILEGAWYNDQDLTTLTRVVHDTDLDKFVPHEGTPSVGRLSFGDYDDNGEWQVGLDPWRSVVPYWHNLLGDRFIAIETSPETADLV